MISLFFDKATLGNSVAGSSMYKKPYQFQQEPKALQHLWAPDSENAVIWLALHLFLLLAQVLVLI